MGDIKRKRKKFSKPRKLYELERINLENEIVKRYGLKNKKEIWKAKSAISRFRKRAKKLIGEEVEKQQKFFEKLKKMGFNVSNISDVLALTEENLLERRLQTFVFKKKIANTPKEARQLIVHKRVLVNGNVVNIPSYIITKELENSISKKPTKQKTKKQEIKENEEE
ncbi:MAG: 30S ribosomal protein S4 [Candidatus Pacearchaeota archaeon]